MSKDEYSNIAKMILNRLNAVFGLEEYFEVEEISEDEFLEEIEEVLFEIL